MGFKKGNMIKLFVAVMLSAVAVAARAQGGAELEVLRQELHDKGADVGAMVSSLAISSEKDDMEALRKKLVVVKGLKNNFNEETQLRVELFQELQKLMIGMRYLSDGSASDEKAIKEKLAALSRMQASLETAVDTKEYKAIKARGESGGIKGQLSSLRAAVQIYYGDMEGIFPYDLSVLTKNSKYLKSIPFIKPPGHDKSSNAVKLVSGVKNMGDLSGQVDDVGGWLYVNDRTSPLYGTVVINCNHRDVNDRNTFMYLH